MIQTLELLPGVTLRCIRDQRFKHGCLSVQLVRPMCTEEAALNALLPAVLLRGSREYPDLRAITLHLDELYGASVGTLVRRVGDYQTTGLYCSFMEDRFAMDGDAILMPMVAFMRQLLLEPALEDGCLRSDYVHSEKKNLIATIEAQRNDKRAYAMEQLIRHMCRGDSFGISRLGEKEQVAAITPKSLFAHYQKILRHSRIELFYVGAVEPDEIAALLKPVFEGIDRDYVNLPAQTAFHDASGGEFTEQMEVSQGKLCMGFVTTVTIREEGFVAMQLLNLVLGGDMTSKLFMQVRERLSLCYAIGSGYHGSKGILTVSAGIDPQKQDIVRQEILAQLEACCRGQITEEELTAAKESMRSSLLAVHDSPGAMEGYYASAALSGLKLSPEEYMQAVEQTTVQQVAAAARTLRLHTVYFLKGVTA